MTDTTNRPPLWEAMEQARDAVIAAHHPFAREEQCLAAEIRAVAEEVERRGALGLDRDPGETADWLRAEADRAERGDHG